MVPACMKPVVRTVKMFVSRSYFDSRFASTSDSEYNVSPSNTGAGSRTPSQLRSARSYCEISIHVESRLAGDSASTARRQIGINPRLSHS